jgi:hypothetical protein
VTSVGDFGVVLQLGPGVRGLCPARHLGDTRIRDPAARFKVGKELQCRVLSVDPARRKLLLTHKKTLVTSTLPVLSAYEDAAPGMLTHGVVLAAKVWPALPHRRHRVLTARRGRNSACWWVSTATSRAWRRRPSWAPARAWTPSSRACRSSAASLPPMRRPSAWPSAWWHVVLCGARRTVG